MSKKLLILARGEFESFLKLNGSSIFDKLPCKGVILADRGNAKIFEKLTGNFTVEVVRWSDEPKLIEKAQELHQEHKFEAIATLDESNVGLAADLRELLNIDGLKSEQGQWFRDKVIMKNRLQGSSIKYPKFTCCSEEATVEEMLQELGKLVIKPKDGFGSKEVIFVSNQQELKPWLEKNRAQLTQFEAEEFIEGQLYHVNALVIDGETKLTAPAAYLPGMSNIDFSAGTPFISVIEENKDLKQRLIEFSDNVNMAFEIKNGVTHLECFVSSDGELTFCEVGLRPGGGGIVWMIESQYGVNYSEAVLAIESGCTEHLPPINYSKGELSGLIGIRSNMSGFVQSCLPLESVTDSCIKLKHAFVQPGSFKSASAHCTDFLSLFVFDSSNTESFHRKWREIQNEYQEKLILTTV